MLTIYKSEFDCLVSPRPYCDVMLNRNTRKFMSLDFYVGLGLRVKFFVSTLF